MSGVQPAADPDFPVQVTARAQRKLFWRLVNSEQVTGCGLRCVLTPTGVPHVEYCDVYSLDAAEHRVSKFGRAPIAVANDQQDVFAGHVLDCRSFPPGPTSFFLKQGREGVFSAASHPGRFRLSLDRIRELQPDLFDRPGLLQKFLIRLFSVTSQLGSQPGDTGWIARWFGPWDPDGQVEAIEAIAHKLWSFATNPAVVLSVRPFVVAAYSLDIDNVMLLRLPDQAVDDGPNQRQWTVGDRMITCNGYDRAEDPSGDLPLGSRQTGLWNDCWCVLADPLTDDQERLDARKAEIPEEQWARCRELGESRLANGDRCRDGRPWLSRVAIRDQRRTDWFRRGGYLS
jgi:hypothetical protein